MHDKLKGLDVWILGLNAKMAVRYHGQMCFSIKICSKMLKICALLMLGSNNMAMEKVSNDYFHYS